jgi:hypothetical protein
VTTRTIGGAAKLSLLLLTAVQNGGAGRPNLVALGGKFSKAARLSRMVIDR